MGASSLLQVTASLLSLCFDGTVHHFNLGRRIPGFDYGPDGFGTGLTPLHLSDDGEGGTFHFHDPPPPYTAYKYPDMDQPDDPPPPYEASINPDSVFYDPAGAVHPRERESAVVKELSGIQAQDHRLCWDQGILLSFWLPSQSLGPFPRLPPQTALGPGLPRGVESSGEPEDSSLLFLL